MNSRRVLLSILSLIVLLLPAHLSPLLSAEAPVKLKSQTIKIHVAEKYGHGLDASFEMVQLPPGKITIKDEKGNQVEHEIKPIWIAKTEVTWEPYEIFWMRLDMKSPWDRDVDAVSRPSKPYEPPDRGWGHDGFPAMTLTFQSATYYCAWLSSNTRKKFRIPTEAEWEYACRAGGPPVKLNPKDLDKVAWFASNSKDEQTHAVAKKQPNAWGLYDMLGNVAEWVIRTDKQDAVAGGSYRDNAADVTSDRREVYSPGWQKRDPQQPKGRSWLSDGTHVGLRVVMEE